MNSEVGSRSVARSCMKEISIFFEEEALLALKPEFCSRKSTLDEELLSLIAVARARLLVPNPTQTRSRTCEEGDCTFLEGAGAA